MCRSEVNWIEDVSCRVRSVAELASSTLHKRVGEDSAGLASWSEPLRTSVKGGPSLELLRLSAMASGAQHITSGHLECYWRLYQLWLKVMSGVYGDGRRVLSGVEDMCGPETLVVRGEGAVVGVICSCLRGYLVGTTVQ